MVNSVLAYKLVKETKTALEYEYYPEGNQKDGGTVAVSKEDGNISILKLSPSDEAKIYAMKLFKRIRQFQSIDEYDKQGTISWY